MANRQKTSYPDHGPDFIGIGVQKCGSSWISDILDQHPQILVSPKKEVGFFTRRFHKGYDWYEAIFREKGDRRAGEFSVNYIYSPRPDSAHKEFYPKWNPRRKLLFWRNRPSARDELKKRYPGIRVLAIFRNPVDRAWSHYWYWRNRKERLGKRIVSFEQMFRDDGRWIRLQGNYADHLSYWRETFPDMGVFFYDDLLKDPIGLARSVFRFVDVNPSFEPDPVRKVNKGRYEPMPASVRTMLVEAYREQILRFSEMTGRNLDHWLALD